MAFDLNFLKIVLFSRIQVEITGRNTSTNHAPGAHRNTGFHWTVTFF